MHTVRSQVKTAARPDPYVTTALGRYIQDMFIKHMGDRPLAKHWDPAVAQRDPADPVRREFDQRMRYRQGQVTGRLADYAQYGLVGGGALGLLAGLPKILKTREALKTPPEEPEEEVLDIGKTAGYKQAEDPGMLSQGAGLIEKGIKSLGETAGSKLYGSIPTDPSLAQGPGSAPSGSLWPLYFGLPLATGIAAYTGVNAAADKVRRHMIMRRKRVLQQQFENILSGQGKTASAYFLDKAAEDYTKQALEVKELGGDITGALLLAGTGLAGLGGLGGYNLAKMYSAGAAKKKALEDALTRKRLDRPLSIHIDPNMKARAKYVEPTSISALDRSTFNVEMPIKDRDNVLADTIKYAQYLMPTGRYSNGIGKSASAYDVAKNVVTHPVNTAKYLAGKTMTAAKPYVTSAIADTPQMKELGGLTEQVKGLIPQAKQTMANAASTTGVVNRFATGADKMKAWFHDLKGQLGKGWDQFKETLKPVISVLMSGVGSLGSYYRQSMPGQATGPSEASPAPAVTSPTSTPAAAAAKPVTPPVIAARESTPLPTVGQTYQNTADVYRQGMIA